MTDLTAPDRVDTLMIHCPVCEADEGETLGVTGEVGDDSSLRVVMACDACKSVYLMPRALSNAESPSAEGIATHIEAIARRRIKGKGIDAIELESAGRPEELLKHAMDLLESGERFDLLLNNVNSSCFRSFGGRHWYGYRVASALQYPSADGIRFLAGQTGFSVRGTRKVFFSKGWLVSLRRRLEDWDLPKSVTLFLTGPWLIPQLVAAAFESIAYLRGRSALLVMELQKS